MRFGGAPDAHDALLLRLPKPQRRGSVFGATLQDERVSEALPNAPEQKRMGARRHRSHPESKLDLACLRTGPG